MGDTLAIITAAAGLIATILSTIFAVSTYYKNKSKEEGEVKTRLTKIETDVLYIRQSIDKREKWEADIEERIRALEKVS